MLLGADGLDQRVVSTSSICAFQQSDADTRADSPIPTGAFWDCLPYSDLSQTLLENDAFSIGFGREKMYGLGITALPNSESSTLFTCRESLPAEISVLKQAAFGDDDSWRLLISPGLLSPMMDNTFSPSLLDHGVGKEDVPPSPDSPTLDDFVGFQGATSVWTGSLSTKLDALSPKTPDLTAFVNVPGIPDSPASIRLPRPPTRSQIRPKGLLGWGDTSHLTPSISTSSVLLRQNGPKSPSRSTDVGAVLDPYPLTVDASSSLRKRPRQSTLPCISAVVKSESFYGSLDSSDEDASRDDDDSDDYQPSLPSSAKFDRFKTKPSANPTRPRSLKHGKINKPRKTNKKGSAALALAVVTQIGEAKREAENLRGSLDPDSFDPVRVYHEGGYVVKKRKNQTIPVPVPVPNLHKKSRGRKVPFVSDCASPVPSSVLDVASPSVEYRIGGQPRRSTKSRKKVQTTSASDESDRSFICVVPGCGKCFVRGEHLKRHVRSIHTNERPHMCPFEGCDKSFSRRDNLGQHVRVHLQP